jgi:hypothetical protein
VYALAVLGVKEDG